MRCYIMKEYDLNKLIENHEIVDKNIQQFIKANILVKQPVDIEEINGHILKSDHNLRFVAETIKQNFLDWAITGCYYASYHAALALIMTKNYSSKNHLATLCVLIKEFYKKGLNKEDIELISLFLDYKDILFYLESKNKREDAAYSTKTRFDKKEVEALRIKAVLFASKIKAIIGENLK